MMDLRKLKLKIVLLFIDMFYGLTGCKHHIKEYFLKKKLNRLASWNFSECKTICREWPALNDKFHFYIVDYYKFPHNWGKYPHMSILEMRNRGLVNTKYFHTEKEAKGFLQTL